MKEQVLYDVLEEGNGFYGITLLIPFLVLLSFFLFNPVKEKIKKKRKRIITTILACIYLIFFISIKWRYHKDYLKVKRLIDQNKYSTVSGYTSKFGRSAQNHKYESFLVNNVYFEYSSSDFSNYGYNKELKSGGVIPRNDMFVRINYYTKNNRNIIIKIILLTTPDSSINHEAPNL